MNCFKVVIQFTSVVWHPWCQAYFNILAETVALPPRLAAQRRSGEVREGFIANHLKCTS